MDGNVTRGIADFDFLIGSWAIENERLTTRLAGSADWERFSAISTCRKLLGGTGNLEEMTIPERSFHGLALRIFDLESGLWSIHWADNLRHSLLPPMVGRFEDGLGTFLGDEEHAGQSVLARFIWFPSVEAPRWEQAFSADGGQTWETNWVMRYSRTR